MCVLTARNTPGADESQDVPPSDEAKRARMLDLVFVGVLALGAFLRLFQIDAAQFWKDSASTYALSHDMLTIGGFPVTGIPFSIGTFSPPTSVYLYMLPSLLGNPTLGGVETALATIAAIALTYYICRLYLNPAIGLVTALLFGISAGSISFSRFIWPPNYITPFAVLLLATILAGVVGKRRGWLAWALPFLGVLIQMHPVTAGLVVLLILGWLLAPETVRIRDLVVGGAAAIAVYLPLIVFEVTSGFVDLRTYKQVATAKPIISATVFHRFLDINSLAPVPELANSRLYHALNLAWEALLICGLLYLAWRVLAPMFRAIRASRAARDSGDAAGAAAGWRGRIADALGWMRADSQLRWRTDLMILLWPALILVVQIRHTTPIELHYLIATFPAQFLAAAVLLYDLRAAVPRLIAIPRLAAAGAFAISSVLVAVVCVTQIIAIPASFMGPQSRSLQAQKAGLTRAEQLANQYHVSQVIFQLDYQTVAATDYMLATNYHFSVPTQIVSSGACLAGAPANADADNAPILYLMTGKPSRWENVVTQIPGVHDLMGDVPEGDYYRAYLVTHDQLTNYLQPFGAAALTAPISFGATPGDTIVADHLWQAPQPDQPAPALAIEAHLTRTQTAAPFHLMYGLTAALTNSAHESVAAGNMYCTIAPWTLGQAVYFMIPQIMAAAASPSDTLTLAAGNRVYAAANSLHIGSLHLISAFDLTSAEYIAPPTATQTFAVQGCGQPVVCAGADTVVLSSSG